MKKLVCGCFGTIYYATITKNGLMSSNQREDVTDDAVNAVLEHCRSQEEFQQNGFFGYKYTVGGVPVNIIAYDTTKYKLVKIEKEDTEKEQNDSIDL